MAQSPSGTGTPSFAPRAGAPFDWPTDFGTRFTIFVDTEEEFDWSAPLSRSAHSTTAMAALPEAHRRLREAGAALTYLIDYPVATAPAAVDSLNAVLADGRTAIGTQLHPWVNPPFEERVTGPNSFAGNLDSALEAGKLDVLTEAIARTFGARPLVYRAGRYGIGPATLSLLAERGYRIDSSMRSRYDYASEDGPNFGAVGNHAFRRGTVVELPLTTVFTGLARRAGPGLYRALGRVPKGRGLFARAGLLSRVALTPEDMPVGDALEAIRVALGEGVRLMNFSFHSPSLVPGFTPYVRDEVDLKRFYAWWDAVLDLLGRRNVAAATQDDIIAAIDRGGPLS